MADPLQVATDPKFLALPESDQHTIMGQIDPRFGLLPDSDKAQVLQTLQRQSVSRPDLAPPPGIPKPQLDMRPMQYGEPDAAPPPPTKMGPSTLNAPDWVGEGIAGATGAGVAALGGAPAAMAAGKFAAKHPFISSMAISEARNIPYIGKRIPSYAEWAPFFLKGEGAVEKPPKDVGDPFRNVPKPAPPDVFNVKEPPATPSGFPRVSDTPSPYRMGPGEVAPESTAAPNPNVLAGNQGIRTTPIGALPPAPEPAAPAAERVPIQNAPYTMSGESTARQILGGFDNQTLLKIAKSRGISVTAESQLKPTVANNRIIGKIVDDMKPEELEEIRSRYIESTRQPLPQGIGPEAYRTAAQSTYFPDLKVSKAKLGRMQKALAQRGQ